MKNERPTLVKNNFYTEEKITTKTTQQQLIRAAREIEIHSFIFHFEDIRNIKYFKDLT